MPPGCALLGGFAIGARVALLHGNITPMRNVSEYIHARVLALCLVSSVHGRNHQCDVTKNLILHCRADSVSCN